MLPCEDPRETRRDPRDPASAAPEGSMYVARPQAQNRRPVHRRRRGTGAAADPSPRGLDPSQHKSLRSSLPPQSNAAAIASSRGRQSSRRREDRPSLRSSMPPQTSAATTHPRREPDDAGGAAPPRSRFEKGMDVYYCNRSPAGATAPVPARILDVHYDDVEPYYTILLEGGAEKQTDDDHLALALPGPHPRGALDGSHNTDASPGMVRNLRAGETESAAKFPGGGVPGADDGTIDGTIQTERTMPVDPEPSDGGVRDMSHDQKEERDKSIKLQRRNTSRSKNNNHGHYLRAKEDDAQGRPSSGRTSVRMPRSTVGMAPNVNARRKGRHPPQSGLSASCVARPARDPPTNWNVSSKETDGEELRRGGSMPVNTAGSPNRRITKGASPRHNNCLEVKGRVEEDRLFGQEVPPEEPAVRKIRRGQSLGASETSSSNRRLNVDRSPRCYLEVKAREGEVGHHRRLYLDEDDSFKKSDYLKQRTLSTVEPDSILASSIASSHEDALAKGSASSPGLTKRKMHEHRCADSDGAYGFYTGNVAALHAGTIDERDAPHGRGEMAYDDGTIVAGVWSKGELQLKVPPDRDRHVPRVLPGYKVGDAGHMDDMMRANAATIGRLHVGDAAFIRRSDPKKRWSYAIVKSRADGGDISITFQVNTKTSTKTISATKWSDHVRLLKRPDVLPGYAAGDRGRDEDMIMAPEEETLSSLSKLGIGDAAFVCRANGDWVYAIVRDRIDGDEDATITFDVDLEGGAKSVRLSRCGTCVRRVRQEVRRDPSREEDAAPAEKCEVDFQASNVSNVLTKKFLGQRSHKSPPLPQEEALINFVRTYEEGRVGSGIDQSQQDVSLGGEVFHLSNKDQELVHT